ncbi:hypothetical protein B0H13DRAFT_2355692 [Mycena leptocephala]|nr:hypothetical protein B0H13DRAFT_2355692 [Mycena leptocephala]
MKGDPSRSPVPTTDVFGVREGGLQLTPCAETCLDAAEAAECDGTQICLCTNADFQFKWFSCVQAECQAAELDSAHKWLESGCADFPVSTKPTETTPFLPSNSNADIGSTKVPTTKGPTSSVAPTPTFHRDYPNPDGSQVMYNVIHTLPVCLIMRNRNGARTGAIVASIVAVILIFAVVICMFWVRRRRQRNRERTVRERFKIIESQNHMVPEPSMTKIDAPSSAESDETEVYQSRLVGAAVSDEAQMKQGAPVNRRADSDNVQLTDSPVLAPEESVSPLSNPQQATRDEETMALRLRRVEAQLEALLTMGLPEGLPPSYSG